MKSSRKKRILATILCMVMVLTSNISALAEGDGLPDMTDQGVAASVSEAPVPDAEVPTVETQAVTEQPVQTPAEPVEVPTTPEVTPEPTPEVTTAPAPETEPVPTQEQPAGTTETTVSGTTDTSTEEQGNTSENGAEISQPTTDTTVPTPEVTPEAEGEVFSEETELTQEFRDEKGQLIQKVTAKLPAGAFAAETSHITMEVQYLDTASEKHIKNLMMKQLPEGDELGDYITLSVKFKVDGVETDSLQPIDITFEKSGLEITDTKKANVFYYDPADPTVAGDQDELVEITQRNEMIERLQAAGQSTDHIEDYDLSSIEIKEENRSEKIQFEGRKSTIYGCYVEKTPEQVSEEIPVLNYEDDQVAVSVTAEEAGVIPEGAELRVLPITSEDAETKEQYQEVEKKIKEKVAEEEKEVAGFLAYDITFTDKDGNKMEPNGKVKVSMNYKKAELPQEVVEKEATDAEVTVLHLEEDEKGEVKQVVDMAAEQKATVDTLATTEGTKVRNVEVETESFSVYTVVWTDQENKELKLNFVTKNLSGMFEDISEELGVKDSTIFISGIGNFDNVSTSLEEIGVRYNTSFDSSKSKGYKFKEAHAGSGNGTVVTNISYNPNEDGWVYYDGLSWESWDDQKDEVKQVYLVYEEVSKGNVQEIPTINALEEKIDIDLFNYNAKINETEAANQGFKFHSQQKGIDGSCNVLNTTYTHPYDQRVHQEYLKDNLVGGSSGFPVLENGTSLEYLFEESETNGVTAYNNLTGLLSKDSNGYYNYDSSQYHAQLTDNNTKLTVYNAKLSPLWNSFPYGNFLPFNTLPFDVSNGSENSVAGGRAMTDVWFGMNISFSFMQPKEGLLNGNPMCFEFRGDDDVWVFIDGIKVLDIGGIHDKKEGRIDFQTGKVYVEEMEEISLADLYEEAYLEQNPYATNDQITKYLDSNFKKINGQYTTFKNFGAHDFRMFYLERGGGAANCKIRFNIPTMDKDSINISKEIENYDQGAYSDVEFSYELYVNGNQNPEKNASYTLTHADGSTEVLATDENTGQFVLKHGEQARFDQYNQGTKYYVKEVGISSQTYDHVTIQASGVVDADRYPIENDENSAQSKELEVGTNPTVTFLNRCAVTNMKHLVIKKILANGTSNDSYQMKVTVGGKLYKGDYKVGEDYENAMSARTQNTTDGIITVGANQVAVILGNASLGDKRGIPSGTSFKVEEILQEDNGTYQTPQYAITDGTASDTQKADGYMGTGYASGKIILKKNAEVIVTNRLINTPPPEEEYDNVPHNKYIDYLGDGGVNAQTRLRGPEYYRLYLDVKGIPNEEPDPADIVLILDYSSSMEYEFSGAQRWDYVKKSAKLAVNTLLPEGSKNRVGIVWFDKRANEKNVRFTNNKEDLLDNINGMKYDSGTNYQAAFWNAQDMLKDSSGRKKFVVFITDGEPYQYYSGTKDQQYDSKLKSDGVDNAKEAAVNAAKEFSNLNGFYAVSVGSESGTAFLRKFILPNITAAPMEYKKVIGANDEAELTKAFNTFMGSITKQIGNVSITDQLSEYVEFVDEAGDVLSRYANTDNVISGKRGDAIAQELGLKVNWYNYNQGTYDSHSDIATAPEYTDYYTYKINLNTKTIEVNFGEGYFLERDKVYTISFNVKLTENATSDAMDTANQIGDANTDYPDNVTSSNKLGLFSNTNATLSYERVKNGNKEKETLKDYEKPVVQPYQKVTWDIVKVSKANPSKTLPGAEFTLSQDSKPIYKGITGDDGIVKWYKIGTPEQALNSSQDIEKGMYVLSETKAPEGYIVTAQTWVVEISAKGIKPVIKKPGGENVTDSVLTLDPQTQHYVMIIENKAIYNLPSTGGPGIFVYTIGGTLLLMAAALLIYKMKREEVLKG